MIGVINPICGQGKKLKAYIFLSEDCPICIYMTKSIKEIHQVYKEEVDVTLVFPSSLSNYKTMQLFKEKYGLTSIKGILDEDQSMSKKLKAKITPEAILMDKDGHLLYQGRINDGYAKLGKMRATIQHHDLINAIDASLKGQAAVQPWPNAIGCYITYSNKH